MFLLSFFGIFALSQQVRINKTMSVSYNVSPSHEVIFFIDSDSVTFLLPQREMVSADVFKLGPNKTYQFVGSLGPQIPSFGVYFPNKGKLILKSTKRTTVNCYAIVSSRKCSRVYVSTYSNEIFEGRKPSQTTHSNKAPPVSNISIQNSQDICFIHASNTNVRTKIKYSTEETYDLLYLHDGLSEKEFTGDGDFDSVVFNATIFNWHSDPTTLSNFFSIHLYSNSTLPWFKVNFTTTLSTPLFITDTKENNNNQNPIYDHADVVLLKSSHEYNVVSIITISLFAFIGSLIVVVGLLFITNRIFRNQPDDAQILRREESLEENDFVNQNNFAPDIEQNNDRIDFRSNEVVDISPVDYDV